MKKWMGKGQKGEIDNYFITIKRPLIKLIGFN